MLVAAVTAATTGMRPPQRAHVSTSVWGAGLRPGRFRPIDGHLFFAAVSRMWARLPVTLAPTDGQLEP